MKIQLNKNLKENYEDEIEKIFQEKSIISEDEMVFKGANIASIPFTSNEERIAWIEENAILLKDANYYYVASIDEFGDWVVERCNLHNGYLDAVDDEEVNNEIETYSKEDKVKFLIEVPYDEFVEWLQKAWVHQHDGWNRDYWCDVDEMKFWNTTETKSTSFENGESVVLICHVNGDNNADYNSICESCSSHNCECENSCEEWEWYHESYPDEDFEDMQFDCMCNVGWLENTQRDIEERLESEGYLVEWV